MRVLIVYCHPSSDSFTYRVKEAFIKGLEDAGHSIEISDLYAERFNPVMSENEYIREGFYRTEIPVPVDIKREQKRISSADAIVFVYPVFWTSAPAMLEGWFQRVWTFGFAYGDEQEMKRLKKAVFLVTMGGTLEDEIRREQVEAMKTVMIGDRIAGRALKCEFHVFDRMTRGYGNESRELRGEKFLKEAYELGRNF